MSVDTAVILAGGEGSRLRPLTKNRPKPLLPAANRPIIEYVLDSIIEVGITDVHLVVGYERERVQSHLGASYRNVDLTYHIQEKQLGSGHALLQARGAIDEPFLVVNGDQLSEPSIAADVIDAYETKHPDAAIGAIESDTASEYGVLEITDGVVTSLVERPGTDHAGLLNTGIYVFPPAVFDVLAEIPRLDGTLPLPAAVSELIDRTGTTVAGVLTDGFWTDATYPWDLLTVADQVFRMEWIDMPEHEPHVWVADSATIHPSAELQAPAVVGPDSEVGPGAVVGPTVALGGNSTVAANAVVTNAVIDDGSRVGPNTTAIDAVIGQDVTFGPGGTIVGGHHDVRIDDRVYSDRRLGAAVADRTTLGGAVSVRGGVLIGNAVEVADGVHVTQNLANGVEVQR